MSSNGLAASRWASAGAAAVATPVTAAPTTTTWVGLASSRWASEPSESESELSLSDTFTSLSSIFTYPEARPSHHATTLMAVALSIIWGHKPENDEQLLTELFEYLNSFSSAAQGVLYDQIGSYLGRIEADQIEGMEYDGKYGRECGLWMERVRMKDLNCEFDEFEM